MLKFIGALSSFNTGPNRLRLIEDEPNFVNWITGDPSYKDWKEKQQPIILHLRGSLGSGTTMAARHILRSLWRSTRSANAIVTSFSFNDHDSEARTIMSLLVSLCRQVLLARPKIFLHIMSLTEFLLEERIFTERTLWSVLHLLIQHLPATAFYCVMHSIHYCENPDKLDRILREFSEIAPRLVPGKLKILITSNIPYQLPVFTAASDAYTVIRLDENAHINAAIENTVRGRLRSIPQEIPISESLVEEIVRVCTRQKNYLLSTRKVDILKSLTTLSTESNIEESLRSLPKTLEKSHEHFIGDFKSKWVRTALLSISHASRPLNAEELSVIVALDKYDGTSLSTLTKNLPSNIYGDLIRAAGSLIKVIDGRIFPFHRSMWNILSKMTAKWGDNPHAVLLEKCIGYLRLRKRHKADISSQVELTVLESFSQYATVHWPDHFARTHLKKARAGATENALNFLRDRTMAASWAGDYNNYVGPIGKSSITLDTHPKIACYFGLADRLLVTFIRNRESNPDFMTEAEEALDLAAGEGHKQKVSILLRANVFSPNALGRAAVGGHLPVIKELLENEKFDPDLPDTKGYTPLHYASCAGHENVSIYLLSRWWTIGGDNWVKGNIEALTDPGGYTPLHLATRTGQLKTIRRLISAGAVVAAEDHQGRSCLHLAAQAGFTDIVKFLIEKHRLGTEKTDKEGNTALHWAVEYGHLSTVRTLLDFSQGCNRVNNADATPLRLAAENNHLDILQLLLRYEQERNKSPDGSYDIHTGKHRAEKGNGTFNEHEVPSSWFDAKQVETPLQVASRKGHIEIVSCLLKSDIITGHNGDRDSSIALFLAAEQGHSAIVEELLTHGAGTKMTNVLGNTPLHVAAEGGHYTVIQTLVKRSGPDGIDKANHDGWTPLHKAAYQGSLRLVKFLIEEGASIEPETRASDTPVKIAAQQGHPKVTSYLFTKAMERKKGDLYPRMRIFRRIRTVKWPGSMKNGREAFDNAVVNGHPAVAEALLQAGLELELPLQLKNLLKYATVLKEAPDSWITRSYNKGTKLSTALHLAVRKGYVSSVEYLLGKVNDIHSRDGRGKTPLQIAVLKDDPELCKTILSYCASHKAWPLYEQHRSAVSLSSEDSVTTTDEEISDAERNIWVSTTATPLFLACYHTKENAAKAILEWFKDKEADDTQCHLKLDEVDEETGWAPLHAAADNGNITRILLNAGANPNCKTTNTQATPLAMAAYPNICLDVVTILLAHPECELNPQDRDGGTPLHRAVSGESLSIVKKLASKEVRFDIARNDGCTPLHLAVATGQTEIVKFFVQKRVQVNTTSKAYGTSLTAAVRGGRPEIVQILLKQGVNVNASIGRHPTPLQAAAKLGDLDMIKILLEHGASVDKSGKSGETPLVAAIDGGKEEAALLLWDNGADLDTKDRHGNSLLQLIAKMGSSRMLDRLLHDKPGVQLDCQDGTMNTPLCTAIIHGHEDVALKLLLADPNVNSHSNNACSPLFFAVQYFQSNIVSKLVEKGAYDPAALEMAIRKGYPDLVFSIRRNAKDFNPLGRAPGGASWLWLTVLGGRVEILDALVETDKLPPEDANGKLLLLLAVSRQDTKMVEALLQRRHAPIIEKDSSNRNALILDVLHGSNCLKLLLEGWKKTTAATEIDVRDDEGKTALICACMKSDMKAVSQLLTSGAEPSITDGRKRGPLYWACRRGSEAIFDLIVKKLDARRDPISIKEKINGVGDQGSQYASGLFGAIASNEASLVQRLIETKRIPLDVRDDDGWTPVETARQFGLNFMESQLLAAGFPEEISTQTTDRDKPLEWSSVDRHGSLVVEDGVDVVVKKSKSAAPLRHGMQADLQNHSQLRVHGTRIEGFVCSDSWKYALTSPSG